MSSASAAKAMRHAGKAATLLLGAALFCPWPASAQQSETGRQLTFTIERTFHHGAGPAVLVSVRNNGGSPVGLVVVACKFLLNEQPQADVSQLIQDIGAGQVKYDELRAFGRADRTECYMARGEPLPGMVSDAAPVIAPSAPVQDAREARATQSSRNRRTANPVSKPKPKEASRGSKDSEHRGNSKGDS